MKLNQLSNHEDNLNDDETDLEKFGYSELEEKQFNVQFNQNQCDYFKQILKVKFNHHKLNEKKSMTIKLQKPIKIDDSQKFQSIDILNQFKSEKIIDMNLVFQETNDYSNIKFMNFQEQICNMFNLFRLKLKEIENEYQNNQSNNSIRSKNNTHTSNNKTQDIPKIIKRLEDEKSNRKLKEKSEKDLFMFEFFIELLFDFDEKIDNDQLLQSNTDQDLTQQKSKYDFGQVEILRFLNQFYLVFVINQEGNIFRIKYDEYTNGNYRHQFNKQLFNIFKYLKSNNHHLTNEQNQQSQKSYNISRNSSANKQDKLSPFKDHLSMNRNDQFDTQSNNSIAVQNSKKRINSFTSPSFKNHIGYNSIHSLHNLNNKILEEETNNESQIYQNDQNVDINEAILDQSSLVMVSETFEKYIYIRFSEGACELNDTQSIIKIQDLAIRNQVVNSNRFSVIQQQSVKLDQHFWQCVSSFVNLKQVNEWNKSQSQIQHFNDKLDFLFARFQDISKKLTDKVYQEKKILHNVYSQWDKNMVDEYVRDYNRNSKDPFKLLQIARIQIKKFNLGGQRFVFLRINSLLDVIVVEILDDCSEIFQKIQRLVNEEKCTVQVYQQGKNNQISSLIFSEINNFKSQISNQFYQDGICNYQNIQSHEMTQEYQEFLNSMNISGSEFKSKNKIQIKSNKLVFDDLESQTNFRQYWTHLYYNKVLNSINPLQFILPSSLFDSQMQQILTGPVEVTSHMSILIHLDKSLKSIFSHLIHTWSKIDRDVQRGGQDFVYLLSIAPLMFNIENELVFKTPVFPLPGETLNRFQKFRDPSTNEIIHVNCQYEVLKIGTKINVSMQVECQKWNLQSKRDKKGLQAKIIEGLQKFQSDKNDVLHEIDNNENQNIDLITKIKNSIINNNSFINDEFDIDESDIKKQMNKNINLKDDRKLQKSTIFTLCGNINISFQHNQYGYKQFQYGKLKLNMMDGNIEYEFELPNEEIRVENQQFTHLQKQSNLDKPIVIKAYNRKFNIEKIEIINLPEISNKINVIFGKYADKKIDSKTDNQQYEPDIKQLYGCLYQTINCKDNLGLSKKLLHYDEIKLINDCLICTNINNFKNDIQDLILPTDSQLRDDYNQNEHGNDKLSQNMRKTQLNNLKRDELILNREFI